MRIGKRLQCAEAMDGDNNGLVIFVSFVRLLSVPLVSDWDHQHARNEQVDAGHVTKLVS